MKKLKIAVLWGGEHTLIDRCEKNKWYSFYNSGWKYGFESLGHEVTFFPWSNRDNLPGFDFYLYAPGYLHVDTFHNNVHYPNAFVTEEANIPLLWVLNHTYLYDNVYTLDFFNWWALRSQRNADGSRNHQMDKVGWLPGAVDPTVFGPLGTKPKYNGAFLGNYDARTVITGNDTRYDYLQSLDKHAKLFLSAKGFYAFEANKVWNNTKIGVDIPIVDFCSYRLFQIMATGTFCLTRRPRMNSGIGFLLDSEMYGTYENKGDLIHHILPYWLQENREGDRLRRAKSAQEYVLKHHTFRERALHLLTRAGLDESGFAPDWYTESLGRLNSMF